MTSRKRASWSESETGSSDGAGQPQKEDATGQKHQQICGCLDFLHLCSFQKLEGYNPAYIKGLGNLRMSSFKDHAARTMHVRAMSLHLVKNKNI